jgi:DNA-binding HxlR family transcriptional regulator
VALTKYKVTFKGDQFDIALEGDSAEEVVSDFLKTRKEIENALKSQEHTAPISRSHKSDPKALPPARHPPEVLSISELSVPNQIKDAFIESRQRLSNWDTLFFLLHYKATGLTNKQLRSLSEELGKPISSSWLDTSFHRRDDEGLVMSKRVPGQQYVVYFLTELGKKEAGKLIHTFENQGEQGPKGR